MTGRVYLVGAGPGHPGLITIRGARLLETADVVLHDYLADPALLDLVPGSAEIIYVGKTGAHKGARQRQQAIFTQLVEHARAGRTVVRLKGGDPFLFGRGGEEAAVLQREGIPFEVVPGVTSAIAAAAYAGIPVTHRDHNTCVAIVTGHEDPRALDGRTDWAALANIAAAGGTVVMLMGVKNLRRNLSFLAENGVPAEMPAALVRWGTRPEQQTLAGTVGTLADLRDQVELGPPAIAIVGSVVALRDQVAWFEALPLAGCRVLITRSAASAAPLERELWNLGARPIVLPTIESAPPPDLEPLDDAVANLGRYDWVVFTSSRAVDALFDRLRQSGRDARAFAGCRLAVVGHSTNAALATHGLTADLVPDQHDSGGLADALLSLHTKPLHVLFPRAVAGRETLVNKLRAAGVAVDLALAYDMVLPAKSPEGALRATRHGEFDAALFASPSAATNLVAMIGPDVVKHLRRATVVAIGNVTRKRLLDLGLTDVIVPDQTSVPAMVSALSQWSTNRDPEDT